ncbi:MAG: PD-(D/E)XK nuclease-like domain-containing protein [Candidatus Pacearchaeota archaeon]
MQYPTIIYDMNNDEYHSREEISKSDMDKILRSPEYYKWAKTQKNKQTPAMRLGSLVHTMILQPENFVKEYVIGIEKKDQRNSANKVEWLAFLDTVGNRTIITQEEFDKAHAMREAFFSSETASTLLSKATAIESSAFWIDEETQIKCKCRPDFVLQDKRFICDLKTASDANFNEFRRTIVNRNYDLQCAHYLKGYSIASGIEYNNFIFIVIESDAPYGVAIYAVNEAVIEAGEKLRNKILKDYSNYINNGIKNVYPDTIQYIDMAYYGFDIESR